MRRKQVSSGGIQPPLGTQDFQLFLRFGLVIRKNPVGRPLGCTCGTDQKPFYRCGSLSASHEYV
jgi:hypothetical protein